MENRRRSCAFDTESTFVAWLIRRSEPTATESCSASLLALEVAVKSPRAVWRVIVSVGASEDLVDCRLIVSFALSSAAGILEGLPMSFASLLLTPDSLSLAFGPLLSIAAADTPWFFSLLLCKNEGTLLLRLCRRFCDWVERGCEVR